MYPLEGEETMRLMPDEGYITARNKFVLTAAGNAERAVRANRSLNLANTFSREMTRLTEEAGLIGPGNLALFDNTKIRPFDVDMATGGRRT
jgi:hypothetical protein